MSKVMFVATVVQKHINVFHLPYLNMFKQKNWETIVCAKNDFPDISECNIPYCDKYYDISFSRNPFSFKNFNSYKNLKKIINTEKPDIIHCHTPVAGVLTRLAALKTRKYGTKVMYTAHGFHFYKGAPLTNWLIYYTVEKLCSYFTDVLITINDEDYALAQKKMKAKKVVYVPGVGIDLQKYACIEVDRTFKRKEIGVPIDAKLLISIGEINENKNHETVIRALNKIENDNIYYVIAGKGGKQEYLEELVDKLSLNNNVKFLGYRTDIIELYKAADICIFPSYREGLSIALMEAMCCSLPCAVSKIRGNTDLIDENGGVLFNPHSVEDCKNAINIILTKDMDEMGHYNAKKIKDFDIDKVIEIMRGLYNHE